MTVDEDENEDDGAGGHTRYPVMPSLVAMQQMRNRLHLAFLGKKLMKWSAVATGKELRKLSLELTETYKAYGENVSEAFLQLARARYFHPRLNTAVLENVGTEAAIVVELNSKSITGVKVLQFDVIDNGVDPYQHLGIEKGGYAITEAKMKWRQLIKLMVLMLQQKTGFENLDAANKNATKKQNVLTKLVIPKIQKSLIYIMSELEEQEREETFRLKRFKGSKMKKADKEIASKKAEIQRDKIELEIIPEIVMPLPIEEKVEPEKKEEPEVIKQPENIGEPDVIKQPETKEIKDVCTCCHSITELDKDEFVCPICKLLHEARDTGTEIKINIVPCKTCLPEVTNNKEYFEHLMAHVNQVIKMTKYYQTNAISLSDIQENINNSSLKQTHERTSYSSTDIKQLTGLFLPKDKVTVPPKTVITGQIYTNVCTCLIEDKEKASCACENLQKSESCHCPSPDVKSTTSRPTPNSSQESCTCLTPQKSPIHMSYNASYLAGEINHTAICLPVQQVSTTQSDYQTICHIRATQTDSSKTFKALGPNKCAVRLTKASDLYLKQYCIANPGNTFLNDLSQRIAAASASYFNSGASRRHASPEVSRHQTTTTELPHSKNFSTYIALMPQFHSTFAHHIQAQDSTSYSTVIENPSSLVISSESCSCNIAQFATPLSSVLCFKKSDYPLDNISHKSLGQIKRVKNLAQTTSSNTLTSLKYFESQNSKLNSGIDIKLTPNCTHKMTDIDDLSYYTELEKSSSYETNITTINFLRHTYITMFQQHAQSATQDGQNGFNNITVTNIFDENGNASFSPITPEGQPGTFSLTNNSVNFTNDKSINTPYTREGQPGPCGITNSIIVDNFCGRTSHACSRDGKSGPCGLAKCIKEFNKLQQQLDMSSTKSYEQQTYFEPYTREGKAGPCGLEPNTKPQYPVSNGPSKGMASPLSEKYQSADILTKNSKINCTKNIIEQFPATRFPKLQSVLVHYIINQSQLKAGIDKASVAYLPSKACRKTQGALDYDHILTATQGKIKKAAAPYLFKTQNQSEYGCMITKMLADIAKASASYTKCAIVSATASKASDFIMPQSTSAQSCTPDNCCTSSTSKNLHRIQDNRDVAIPVAKKAMPCSICGKISQIPSDTKTASLSSSISKFSTTSKKELELGYFETEYEEITKVSRYKDLTGNVIDQKQVITMKTEKKYPQKPCCTDSDPHRMNICVDHCQEYNVPNHVDNTVFIPDRKTCRVAKSDIVGGNKDIVPCPKIRTCLSTNEFDKQCENSTLIKPDPLKQQISSKFSCKSSNSGQSSRLEYSYIVDECDCSTSMSNNALMIQQLIKHKESTHIKSTDVKCNSKIQNLKESRSDFVTCNPSTCPKFKNCLDKSKSDTKEDARNLLKNSGCNFKIISKPTADSYQKADDEIILTKSAIDLLRKLLLSSKFLENDDSKNVCDRCTSPSHNSFTSESIATCALCASSQDQQHGKERNCCIMYGSNDPMSTNYSSGVGRLARSGHSHRHCHSNKSLTVNKLSCSLDKNYAISRVCCDKNEKNCTETELPQNLDRTNRDVGTSTRLKDKYDVRPICIAKNQHTSKRNDLLSCKCHSDECVYGISHSSMCLHKTSSSRDYFSFYRW